MATTHPDPPSTREPPPPPPQPSTAPADAEPNPDPEPIDSDSSSDHPIATYTVYLTPSLCPPYPSPTTKPDPHQPSRLSTHLLQFPTRERRHPYNLAHGCRPRYLRTKPVARHLELDVPLNTATKFNAEKARKWANAMGHANAEGNRQRQSGGKGGERSAGFGLANGFVASGAMGARGPVKGDEGSGSEEGSDDEGEGEVFDVQTLAGQLQGRAPSGPHLFVGAFRGEELHLTGVEGVAQMRPAFHHVDAAGQMARYPGTARGRGGGGGGGGGGGEGRGEPKPRLLHATGKVATQSSAGRGRGDGGPPGEYMGAKDLLNKSAEEPWSTLWWKDEEEDETYSFFHERMFLPRKKEERGRLRMELGREESMENEVKAKVGEGQYLDGVSGGVLERRRAWEKGRKRGARRKKVDNKGKGKEKVGEAPETVELEDDADADASSESSELSEVDDDISEHVDVMEE